MIDSARLCLPCCTVSTCDVCLSRRFDYDLLNCSYASFHLQLGVMDWQDSVLPHLVCHQRPWPLACSDPWSLYPESSPATTGQTWKQRWCWKPEDYRAQRSKCFNFMVALEGKQKWKRENLLKFTPCAEKTKLENVIRTSGHSQNPDKVNHFWLKLVPSNIGWMELCAAEWDGWPIYSFLARPVPLWKAEDD